MRPILFSLLFFLLVCQVSKSQTERKFSIYLIKGGVSEIVKLEEIKHGQSVDVSSYGDVSILYEQKGLKSVSFYKNDKFFHKESKKEEFVATKRLNGVISPLVIDGEEVPMQIVGRDASNKYLPARKFTLIKKSSSAKGEGGNYATYLIKAGVKEIVKLKQIRDRELVDISSYGDVSILYEQSNLKSVAFLKNGTWFHGDNEQEYLATPRRNGIISPLVLEQDEVGISIQAEYVTGGYMNPARHFKLTKKGSNAKGGGKDYATYLIKAGVKEIVKLKQIEDGDVVDISSYGDVSILYEQSNLKAYAFLMNKVWLHGGEGEEFLATHRVNGIINPLVLQEDEVDIRIQAEYVTGGYINPARRFKLTKKGSSAKRGNQDYATYLIKAGVKEIVKLKQIKDGDVIDISSYGDVSILYEQSNLKAYAFLMNKVWLHGGEGKEYLATQRVNGIISPLVLQEDEVDIRIQAEYVTGGYINPARNFKLTKKGSSAKASTTTKSIEPRLSNYNWSGVKGGNGKVEVKSLSSSDLNAKDVLEFVLSGPEYKQSDPYNPFLDLDLQVVFTHQSSGKEVVRPIYFSADGNAKETNVKEGNVWKTRMVLSEPGKWSWKISALGGSELRAQSVRQGSKLTAYDGKSGSVNLKSKNRSIDDALAKGELQYVGKHYLKYSSGEYYLKNAIAAPATLLGSSDFSDTQNTGVVGMSGHIRDWGSKDPLWQKTKGKESIGAINYLANNGINAISFVLDGRGSAEGNVYPYQTQHDATRFSVAKLEQWEVLFDHALKQGIVIEFVLSDESVSSRESTYALDFGKFGKEHRLLCRELVARYGHYPNVIWNTGLGNKLNVEDQLALGEYMRSLLGEGRHMTIGVTKDRQNIVYPRLMNASEVYTGVSIQTDWYRTNKTVEEWVGRTESETTPWVVNVDRVEPLRVGIAPQSLRNTAEVPLQDLRGGYLWGSLLSGGSGFTHYFGSKGEENQTNLVDFRSRDIWWESCRVALNFFDKYLPYAEMKPSNELIGNRRGRKDKGFCFAKEDDVYAVYVPNGQKVPELDLKGASLGFEVRWYDPRSGGGLQKGSVTSVDSGEKVNLGKPPFGSRNDWVVLVTKGNKVKGGVTVK